MSRVSGVTLICRELATVETIIAALDRIHPGDRFRSVANQYGGGKISPCKVFGAGINALDEDGFAEAVMALPWTFPENVLLVIQPEEGPTRVWSPWAPGQPLGGDQPEREFDAWEALKLAL